MDDDKILIIMQDLAAVKESLKSAHKRIDENDALTAQIHKLAMAVETLTTQVKAQNGHMEKVIENVEQGQRSQGERIGSVEKDVMAIKQNEKAIEEQRKKLEEISKAPAERWDKFTWLVISVTATAVISFLVGRIL